uniref:Protein kinase domain-containing protein n=1 Tax=Panagrolaimus sp. PS1159 TaxID=55785 RepID=A0AC35G5Y9_9BILA
MTIGAGGAVVGMATVSGGGPSSRSNSKTKNSSRISNSKIRHGGSSSGGAGSSSAGGHPFAGADPNAPKREIKQRFEITKKLGSGTYGKVSLAYDHKFDREVAVKLIKKSAIENKQDLVRIRREIRIMSALNHPNIIQIFEVFENKDKIILVMEYASGGELYDYVSKNGSLPEGEARRIFRQITSAVLYCHKHKVAHRDLKLENILLDVDNNAKIADFGLSNYFTEKILLTTFCGSPLYASPEIINGTPYRGPEVDCWSLGILLYTLVYGSMPFDGRDFNRMVRQIKRGAYYEPDTPSTASMLIRNMLRVNPERRADIDDIASHWWLNLEENMPVIQELPENQITDYTPLPERAETMIVQDLADETDVFMEFGHLSSETRKKIEEFRRRRKEAEEYNENSPIKPPKARKLDEKSAPEMTSKEKSLRHEIQKPPPLDLSADKRNEFSDPLERLRQLENRLQGNKAGSSSPGRQTPVEKPGTPTKQPGTPTTPKNPRLSNFPLPAQPASPQIQQKVKAIEHGDEPSTSTKKPYFASINEPKPSTAAASSSSSSAYKPVNTDNWRIEIDSLSLLMNQILEQMEKGPVSMNLVARVKAHPFYDQRPMVKELLESIIAAQPKSVQKQASKIIQQQSQDIVRRQISNHNIAGDKKLPDIVPASPKSPPQPAPPTIGGKISNNTAAAALKSKYQVQELPIKVDLKSIHKPLLEERPWHSVEVGFETDEDSSENAEKILKVEVPKVAPVTREVKSDGEIDDEEDEDEEEEDEEEYESDIDELAEVVEQVTKSKTSVAPQAPKIVENLSKDSPKRETQQAPTPVSANHLSTFDRGLAKRQSKGKYQHNHVELYGRGVSTEAESPPPSKRRIGGPQPTPDQSPVLFDKAKKYIMKYPDKCEDSDEEKKIAATKKKKDRLKSQDPDVNKNEATRRGSEPPRDPPTINDVEDEESEYEDEESEEESEEEEEEGDVVVQQHRTSIIGYRTITPAGPDGVKKAAPIVPVRPQSSGTTPPATTTNTSSTKLYSSPAMNGTTRPQDSSKKPIQAVQPANKIMKETPPNIPLTITTPATPVSSNAEYGGIQKWESAAAYIRRKNRERRLRNRTIGTPDEITSRPPAELEEPVVPKKKEEEPPKYTTQASPITGYTRPSYLDERKMNEYRPHNYIDRRKSFHEMSPGFDEDRHSPGYSYDRQPRYGTTTNRYEDESLDNWMNSRNRFEVYQTRAERAAEMNTGGYSYRPTGTTSSSYWHNDRPTSAYIPGAYKSRFDDNFSYRRSTYDVERPVTPGTDYSAPSTTSYYPQTSSIQSDTSSTTSKEPFLSRFRPVTRRIGSALRDSEARKARARSQSTERKLSLKDENDQIFNPRLMTPEIGSLAGSERSDYSYINYHDSASGRISQPREPDVSLTPARGILKNKQATDLEPRATSVKGDSGVKQIFGRLRRHLSHEKSPSPLHSYSRYGSLGPSSYNPINYDEGGRGRTPSGAAADYESASKKRGFLNMNRRRTTEVRMGPDGKIITNGYGTTTAPVEEDYKRPRSPIDRIKSLFRKSKDNLSTAPSSTVSSTYHSYNPAGPNSASSRFSTNDKIFGSYPSSTQSTSHQFKRYTGGKTFLPVTGMKIRISTKIIFCSHFIN